MKTMQARQVISGRYQISGRIGSGGMGEVLRARDSVLGRTVALKVLPPELAMQPEFIERFRAEAQAAAQLSHPNVVQVHDWGEEDDTYYMVMEYVRGRNLRQILAARGAFEPSQAADVIAQVLQALSAAHEKGLVHRDIKPENVIVAVDGTVKVTDFGIARAVQAAGITGSMLGTVAYAAPEQARGARVDGRTDLYSTGCVLFELLTGSRPFEGDAVHILHQHLNERVGTPSNDAPGAEPLDGIVLKATEPVMADRFPSAVAMWHELTAAANALPEAPPLAELTHELTSEVHADAIDTVVPGRKKKRHPWRWILAFLLAVAVGAGVMYLRPLPVPELIGLPQTVAEKRLDERGLSPAFERQFSSVPEGTVVKTEPAPGEDVRRGGSVKVVVSAGPELTDAPAVIGLQLEAARELIKSKGLAVGEIGRTNAREPVDKVLDQDPKPGKVRRGDPINLVVSDGPKILDVPAITGKSLEDAQSVLSAAGLASTRESIFSDVPVGAVADQVPKAGEKAEQGTEVKLLVSKGPRPFAVPDVKAKPCSEAKSQLESVGMVVAVRSAGGQTAQCGVNRVLEQEPLASSSGRKGQEAILYVS